MRRDGDKTPFGKSFNECRMTTMVQGDDKGDDYGSMIRCGGFAFFQNREQKERRAPVGCRQTAGAAAGCPCSTHSQGMLPSKTKHCCCCWLLACLLAGSFLACLSVLSSPLGAPSSVVLVLYYETTRTKRAESPPQRNTNKK